MSDAPATKEDVREIIREELRPVWRRIERHDREIYGHNGTPGIMTKVEQNSSIGLQIKAVWLTILGGIGTYIFRNW